jgi:DNA-binding winged helix-turn-helix (wHTH) protein
VRFGDFELDLRSGKLFRGGRPVKIQLQLLRVLAVLLESEGENRFS